MILNWIKIALIAVGLIILSSCQSDDPIGTSSDNFSDFFPTNSGNWWKYEDWETDEDGERIANTDTYIISYAGTTMVDGKMAIIFITNHSPQDTSFFFVDGSKLYAYGMNFFDENAGWVLFGDLKSSKWTISETQLEGEIEGYPFSGTTKVSGSRGKIQNRTVMGKSVECVEFIIEILTEGSAEVFEQKIPVKSVIRIHTWFGKNVGMVESIVAPSELTIAGETTKEGGMETVLLDYNIQ